MYTAPRWIKENEWTKWTWIKRWRCRGKQHARSQRTKAVSSKSIILDRKPNTLKINKLIMINEWFCICPILFGRVEREREKDLCLRIPACWACLWARMCLLFLFHVVRIRWFYVGPFNQRHTEYAKKRPLCVCVCVCERFCLYACKLYFLSVCSFICALFFSFRECLWSKNS